jgi:hypothetical protein
MEKRNLVGLLAVIVVAAGLYWWFTRRSGEEDFGRAKEALKSVRSFRVQTASGEGGEQMVEIIEHECPSSTHITRKMKYSQSSDYSSEEIQVGAVKYYRDSQSSSWIQGSEPVENPDHVCNSLASVGEGGPFPPLTEMSRRGLFKQGSVVKVNNEKCREWHVQMVHPLGTRKETVCLGVDDFIPRRWSVEGSETTYYDFNKPIGIRAPAATAASASEY